jgi:hypothetical protein
MRNAAPKTLPYGISEHCLFLAVPHSSQHLSVHTHNVLLVFTARHTLKEYMYRTK